LVPLLTLIRYKLELTTPGLVVFREPLQQTDRLAGLFHLKIRRLVHELVHIFLLVRRRRMHNDLFVGRVSQDISQGVQTLENDQRLDSSELESLEGVVDSVAVLSGVLGNLVEVLLDKLLLLYELDIGQGFGGQLDS